MTAISGRPAKQRRERHVRDRHFQTYGRGYTYMVERAAIENLRKALRGEVILPTDSAYDESRKIFNAMHEGRPAVIARCASTQDVVEAVNFGRENGLEIAVRCGGHSVVGFSSCDDGILIDLGGLKSIEVDPEAKIARAGGGVLWGEFDAATQEHGLHTPGGRVTTTGLGGFTTGGGYGWTSSKYGLTCDNLLSAEVVLANGSVVTASADENPDLFWGLRGGGGNFGVVTRFDFRLHELGPMVLAGLALWPIERSSAVLRGWRDYVDQAPNELSTGCVILTAPPEPFVPDHMKGKTVIGMAVMYVGDPEEGKQVVKPLKDLAPEVDLIGVMPYTGFQGMLDAGAPSGLRNYWRGEYINGMSDEAIETFAKYGPGLTEAAPPLSQLILFRIGQGVTAVPDEATAFSHREADYLLHPLCLWSDAGDDAKVIGAIRDFCESMRPFTTGGAYLNFTPEDRVRDAYGESKYDRLVALKSKYDPANLFHRNQNIKPRS